MRKVSKVSEVGSIPLGMVIFNGDLTMHRLFATLAMFVDDRGIETGKEIVGHVYFLLKGFRMNFLPIL